MGIVTNKKCALALAVLMIGGCGDDSGGGYEGGGDNPGTGGNGGGTAATGGGTAATGGGTAATGGGTAATGGGGGTVDIGELCANAGPAKEGQCKEQAEGVYALKVDIDTYWANNSVVDGGRGTLTMYLIGEVTDICQDGSGGLGTMRACGAGLPTFVSDTMCDAYEVNFDDSVWSRDNWAVQPVYTTTGSATGFEVGDTLSLHAATGLFGIELDDMNGAWPEASVDNSDIFMPGLPGVTCAGSTGGVAGCFPDHDGDGQPGVTVTITDTGADYDPGYACSPGPVHKKRGSPVNLLDGAVGGGGSGAGARATKLGIGMRVNVGGSGAIASDCASGVGAGEAMFVDSRVGACTKRADQDLGGVANSPCIDGEIDFIDVNLPKFIPLNAGESPPALNYASNMALPAGTVSQAASEGARSSVVRLSDITTKGDFGGLDCAAVRSANFPAL